MCIRDSRWSDRDRLILSAGHGSMLLYSLLYLTGYDDFPLEEIKNFRQLGAKTAGHPENFLSDAIETTTGPLGQGIANSVGFAMAEDIQRANFGKSIVDHYTYVFAGDGCLMEGVSQEAITIAGRQKLSKLIVFWDNNNITIDGKVELSDNTNQVERFRSSGWHVLEIDGHNPVEIDQAIIEAKKSNKPTMIACETHIALGSSAQDTSKGHGALTDSKLIEETKKVYGWSQEKFYVPPEVKKEWEEIGKKGRKEKLSWENRYASLSPKRQFEFSRMQSMEVPPKLAREINKIKKESSHHNCCKHTCNYPNGKSYSKTFDGTCTKLQQSKSSKKCSNICIQNSSECFSKSFLYCGSWIFSPFNFFTDALEN